MKLHFINFSLIQFLGPGGNYDSRFDVDKGTGTIIVARPLDAEQKSNYNLTVEATDGTRTIGTQVMEFLMTCLLKEEFLAVPLFSLGQNDIVYKSEDLYVKRK